MDKYFDHAGATIAYEVTGTGAPLGYAHGVPLSREAVRRLGLLDLDELARGRQFLSYDARAHGRSTGRPVADDYRFEGFAADLVALLDELGLDRPMDLTGSSLGADTTLRAAIAVPERFRRLVLMIPPAGWSDAPFARQVYGGIADTIEAEGPAAWRDQWARMEPLPIFAGYGQFDLTPAIPDDLVGSVFRGLSRSDLPPREQVAAIPHPTLVLTWETDPLHPVSTAQALHQTLPDSRLHVSSTVADIKTWTRRIGDFLAVQ